MTSPRVQLLLEQLEQYSAEECREFLRLWIERLGGDGGSGVAAQLDPEGPILTGVAYFNGPGRN